MVLNHDKAKCPTYPSRSFIEVSCQNSKHRCVMFKYMKQRIMEVSHFLPQKEPAKVDQVSLMVFIQ